MLGRVLDPLAHLSKGMLSLEDGHYATRLALPKVKELAIITERFNTLAGALDTARDENSRLYRQLITVQEEERREIANELHDEAGPCLFGITANASSIQNLANQLPDSRTAEISRRVGEILSITERLKLLNRALLKKLRPGPLGRVKLVELARRTHRRLPAPPSRRAHRRLFRQTRRVLRRDDRPHPLPLHSGRHHQRDPPRQGGRRLPSISPRVPVQRGAMAAERPAAGLTLDLSDDGKGIARADAERIWPHRHDRTRTLSRRNAA